jgi:hypothetical protein
VTLNRHKSAVFEWNSLRLLGYPRRYKHYANAPQCYVIHVHRLSSYAFIFNKCNKYLKMRGRVISIMNTDIKYTGIIWKPKTRSRAYAI